MVARQEKFAVVLLSGGLDSMVAGALAREAGYRLFALSIDYNQRHRVELRAAARVAAPFKRELANDFPKPRNFIDEKANFPFITGNCYYSNLFRMRFLKRI